MYSSCINSAYFTTRKKIWEEEDAGSRDGHGKRFTEAKGMRQGSGIRGDFFRRAEESRRRGCERAMNRVFAYERDRRHLRRHTRRR